MDKLTKLANQHKEWVKIARTFADDFLAEDIVQETYIKIIRLNYIDKIVTDEVNKSLMWLTIHSVFIDHIRKIKTERVGLDDIKEFSSEDLELDKHESYERLHEKIINEIQTWHWYDTKLFTLYLQGTMSIRKISKETNISATSIFNTIRNCKERLRLNVGDDWEDYCNNDYELI